MDNFSSFGNFKLPFQKGGNLKTSILTGTLILLLAWSSLGYPAQTPEVKREEPLWSQGDIDSLGQAVSDFINALYREKSSEKFWIFMASQSKVKELWGEAAFQGFFENSDPQKADPATLTVFGLSSDQLTDRKNHGKVLPLNPTRIYEEFTVFPGSEAMVEELPEGFVTEGKKLGLWPSGSFLLAVFQVTGTGYRSEFVFTFWVRENNQWKLFSLAAG